MSRKWGFSDWNIGTSPLGCGILVLQGWSTGIGVYNKQPFEVSLTELLYFSKQPVRTAKQKYNENNPIFEKMGIPYYGTKILDSNKERLLAPNIGVYSTRYQFLNTNFLITVSSTEEYLKRFADFVNNNGIGEFTYTKPRQNRNYCNTMCAVGVFDWNGELPNKDPYLSVWKAIDKEAKAA